MTDVTSLMRQIEDVGTDPRGPGYLRPGYSPVERELRDWFVAEAERRGLDVEIDANGIVWAWATAPGDNAVITGSHLDSVPGGGQFDGPLGVASALAAYDELASRGTFDQPTRPFALAVFPEEEGSRFGLACLGSRLLTGAVAADDALALTDQNGDTLAEVVTRYDLDPQRMGADADRIAQIGSFIELHVEQGVGLINTDQPVAIGSSIVGHGRWHFRFTGQGNHAGTTPMTHRADPVAAASRLIGDIPALADGFDQAVATVGRTSIHPGGTNVIASAMDFWFDIRHDSDDVVAEVLDAITSRGRERAAEAAGAGARDNGIEVSLDVSRESYSPTTYFHRELNDRLRAVLPEAPLLPTGAGHDAGILAAHVPSAMLFVRNPTGVSHAPEEACEDDDARSGAKALADVLAAELTHGLDNGTAS